MFTGTLSVTREEAQHIVEELGGIAGSSVNRQTDYLVCGEDQVGKSSKWEKAGLLGVTRVDEEYFWGLVKEAKEEQESEEDWSNVKGILPEKVFANVIDFLEEQVKHIEVDGSIYPPVESMTYYSKENLNKWVKKSPALGARTCPYCGKEIPYSIDNTCWYCFVCQSYSRIDTVGSHRCSEFEKFLDMDKGHYESCRTCGKVKVVRFDEIEDSAKFEAKKNYVHSLEFAAEVEAKYSNIVGRVNVVATMSDNERDKWWAKFEQYQAKHSV